MNLCFKNLKREHLPNNYNKKNKTMIYVAVTILTFVKALDGVVSEGNKELCRPTEAKSKRSASLSCLLHQTKSSKKKKHNSQITNLCKAHHVNESTDQPPH